ncbi:OLC1v1008204C1 [Oldenlandia corymbosa var. corymbosa]|uniref:OLC1v1008204C1 n=1 Tax=Oldenlandia corymbosa var. corymbosa TaxID=529605 RepID=A0AAV1DNH3_OLDCO|nr:OLC1v1008204C1 [Oldenlandia corymbosa var. corymbosa]
MFKNTFQSGFLSILYSLGSKPLQIWDKEVVDGQVKRILDEDIQSNVLEIVGSNIQSTYITCPADPNATLGIKLPFLVLIVKNPKKYFTFEIQVLDDKNVRRRFRASNYQVCKFSLCGWGFAYLLMLVQFMFLCLTQLINHNGILI